jgi:hypothetical protein
MFFTISPENITTMTGYISGLVGDFMPVILVVLGISLAMYIFNRITK